MVSLDDLVDYCQQDEWPFDLDAEHNRLRTRFGATHGSFAVTMSVDPERSLVTMMVPFYLKAPSGEVDESSRTRLLELLLAINYEIALGCFEYDPGDGEVRFRLAVACDGVDYTFETFLRTSKAMIWTCNHYFPACQRVLWGALTAREALDSLVDETDPEAADDGPHLTEV